MPIRKMTGSLLHVRCKGHSNFQGANEIPFTVPSCLQSVLNGMKYGMDYAPMSRAIYMADVEQIYCYLVLGVSLIYSIYIYIMLCQIKYMFYVEP